MKQATVSKEAEELWEEIKPRIYEWLDKVQRGVDNAATPFAYEIGVVGDIDDFFIEKKFPRTEVPLENCQEIEMSDIEPLMEKLNKKIDKK